jgi:SSS family solute:Na+ symporter
MSLTLTMLDYFVLAIVMGGSLSFGLYMAYRQKAGQDSSSFFLGGRSMKWPIVGASMFATNIGAEHLVDYLVILIDMVSLQDRWN